MEIFHIYMHEQVIDMRPIIKDLIIADSIV